MKRDNILLVASGLLILSFLCPGVLFSADWGWGNPGGNGSGTMAADSSAPLYERLITWYRADVSPRQGSRCPFHPSCSVFTLYSMKHYGFIPGFIMGLERIYIRENRGLFLPGSPYDKIHVHGVPKYYDHPEANRPFAAKNWTHYNAYFAAWAADSPVFDSK